MTQAEKIDAVKACITSNHKKWFQKFGTVVYAVSLGRKIKDNRQTKQLAVIFHAKQKVPHVNLTAGKTIPKTLEVKHGNASFLISTDVIVGGDFCFHNCVCDAVTDPDSNETGTVGLLLQKENNKVYALTNYHVAAKNFLLQNKFRYDGTENDAHKVIISGRKFDLFKGCFGGSLDAAYIDVTGFENRIKVFPDGRNLAGNFTDADRTANLKGQTVIVYSRSNGQSHTAEITATPVHLRTNYALFQDLLTIERCTNNGDSGSLVVTEQDEVVGIIFGADNRSTYIIPYWACHDFFPLTII